MDNIELLQFSKWMQSEMAGTGAIYDPKQKPKEDWNWQGAVGKIGVSPKKGPIMKKGK